MWLALILSSGRDSFGFARKIVRRSRLGCVRCRKNGISDDKRLMSAGFSVKAFDVDSQRVRATGLPVAASLSEMARSVQIIFTMIPDDKALEELVGGLANDLQTGQILVDMSTVSPAASQRCASGLDKAGVEYVRAPVSGSTVLAAAGKLTIMVSGPLNAIAACRPVFSSSAKNFSMLARLKRRGT
jgi:3-hydroxyisobutyrate dehydrogenase-like beta-hydroxyacid dehydrogenase